MELHIQILNNQNKCNFDCDAEKKMVSILSVKRPKTEHDWKWCRHLILHSHHFKDVTTGNDVFHPFLIFYTRMRVESTCNVALKPSNQQTFILIRRRRVKFPLSLSLSGVSHFLFYLNFGLDLCSIVSDPRLSCDTLKKRQLNTKHNENH
jgi:hypothetical protein